MDYMGIEPQVYTIFLPIRIISYVWVINGKKLVKYLKR